MTELEYREAVVSKKPMLLYVIRHDATVKLSDIEISPEGRGKLENLKAQILRDHVVYQFETAKDLEKQVFEDLGKFVDGV